MATKTNPLRFNNLGTPQTPPTNGATLSSSGTTTLTFTSAPAIPAFGATTPTYIDLSIDPNTPNEEIVRVIAHATGSRTCTVIRHTQTSTARTHTKRPWVNAPTVADFVAPNIVTKPQTVIINLATV